MPTTIQSQTQDLTWFGLSLHPQNRSPSLGCSHWTQICLRGLAPHWSTSPPLDLTDLQDLTDLTTIVPQFDLTDQTRSHWSSYNCPSLDLTDQATQIASHKEVFSPLISLIKTYQLPLTRGLFTWAKPTEFFKNTWIRSSLISQITSYPSSHIPSTVI